MKFIDEQQNVFIIRHFFDDSFDALFELTAVFTSGYHSREVKNDNTLVTDGFRHDAKSDALCKAFGNRRFSDTWLSNEARVIFCPAAQDLNHTLNFLAAADNRVEFSFTRKLRQIPAVLIQCRRFAGLRSTSCLRSAAGVCISACTALQRCLAHGSKDCSI